MSRIQGDLPMRTFEFARRVIELSDALPNNVKGWVIGKQLVRSGTSIGSNVGEADNAFTDNEFAHKCSIARREASETSYWLDLAIASSLLSGPSASQLKSEADELTRILSTIVLRTQQYVSGKHGRSDSGSSHGV